MNTEIDHAFQPIFSQCYISVPPENVRKPSVLENFRGTEM